jgi:hypothetical protein
MPGGEERISSLVETPKNTELEAEELLYNKFLYINKEMALRKTLTAKNSTEQRYLGTLAYKIKCKWENQVNKAEVS